MGVDVYGNERLIYGEDGKLITDLDNDKHS